MPAELYCVYQLLEDGSQERVLECVGAERAVKCAVGLATSVGARIGTTVDVKIVDLGDCCNWHWTRADGVLFPAEALGALKGGMR